ncbi:MAG: GntR family transcriptional regulator [Christensenellales bacterium]
MFTCTLEPASRTPLCEQLYTALKREMERGGIRPGERMPSKRELAAHLSVSTATVEAAYARLISEGLCESRPRSGIYALEQTLNVGAATGEKPPVRWNFGTGAADAAHFPYATWARLMREVLSEQSATLLLSGDPQGEPALRREIAGYLHRMRGMDVPPDAIVLGAGTEVLVSALVALIGRERLCGGGPRLFACAAHSGGQRRADCADAAFRRGHRRARTVSKRRGRDLRYPDPSISDGRGDAARPAGSAAALGARDGRLYFGG